MVWTYVNFFRSSSISLSVVVSVSHPTTVSLTISNRFFATVVQTILVTLAGVSILILRKRKMAHAQDTDINPTDTDGPKWWTKYVTNWRQSEPTDA